MHYIIDRSKHFTSRGFFDLWLYLAHIFLLFAFIQKNMIITRFLVIIMNIFFIVWATIYENLYLDTLLLNILILVINLGMLYPLIKAFTRIPFSEIEEEIYQRDFQKYFHRADFKKFIKNFEPELHTAHDSQLCKFGQSCKEVIYIAKVFEGFQVEVETQSGENIAHLKSGNWIGINEYLILDKYSSNQWCLDALTRSTHELVWGVSAYARYVREKENSLDVESGIAYYLLEKKQKGCVIYRFNLCKLARVMNKREYHYRNSVNAMWIEYSLDILIWNDDWVMKEFGRKKITNQDSMKKKKSWIKKSSKDENYFGMYLK